jgi:amidase
MVPIAHGTDAAGSLRIPAAWCGVVGLKPSRGRIPLDSAIDRNRVEHVLTRTVRDTALVLDHTSGNAPGDLYSAPETLGPYVKAVGADPGTLRLAVLTSYPLGGDPIDNEPMRAALAAADLAAELGHQVEEAVFQLTNEQLMQANLIVTSSMLKRLLKRVGEMLGRGITAGDVEAYTWSLATETPDYPAHQLLAALETQQAYVTRLASDWNSQGIDILITPTVPLSPARLANLQPSDRNPLEIRTTYRHIWSLARPFNLTGQPAISLPLYWSEQGLPIGIQMVASHGREDILLALAGQFERALPWVNKWPELR